MENNANEIQNKKPKQSYTKKIKLKCNYFDNKKNRTSISYEENGNILSIFIKGKYSGYVEIEYKNNFIEEKNIVNVKEK